MYLPRLDIRQLLNLGELEELYPVFLAFQEVVLTEQVRRDSDGQRILRLGFAYLTWNLHYFVICGYTEKYNMWVEHGIGSEREGALYCMMAADLSRLKFLGRLASPWTQSPLFNLSFITLILFTTLQDKPLSETCAVEDTCSPQTRLGAVGTERSTSIRSVMPWFLPWLLQRFQLW